tara:strand:+ start:451 stop:1374 length:924 start_codon:yes stop_codon:yes gene_type:complete
MEKYIKDLTTIIRDCNMENTYKMSWVRSLVELSVKHPQKKHIHFNDLSPLIFKYYWNQTLFFNLNQGPNPLKKPEIHQIVLEEIDKYQKNFGYKPEFYTRVQDRINIDIEKISKTLEKDVSHRFLKVGKKEYPIYELDRKNLCLKLHHPELLKEYSDILFELINYKWVQKLEKLNSSPRISKKVNGTDRENIKRGNLSRFKKYIDLENPNRKCFITNEILDNNDLSIDHVIPWSYLFSDDLWNLVYVKKSENSSKSNRIPNEEMISKLEKRNVRLLRLMEKENKQKEELRLSIDKNFVREFWYGCKG